MRKLLIIFIASLFICAETAAQGIATSKYDTAVPLGQIANVTRDVQQWHDIQYPNCKFVSLLDTKIIKQDKDTANEKWTILGCDNKQFQYRVFITRYLSGISSSVSNLDYSPVKIHKK